MESTPHCAISNDPCPAKKRIVVPLQPEQSILNGKYRILRLIGEGGMARVWLAEEPGFGRRQVAIKEPKGGAFAAGRDEILKRYEREIEVGAALRKARTPNVVEAITAEPYDDTRLLVLDYMPGGDLAKLIERNPDGIAIDLATRIAGEVLTALAAVHAHALDIVHRDIKPSNILFDAEPLQGGRAHLADFGLAQVAGTSQDLTKMLGSGMGTPLYAAPEQEQGKGYLTPASDIYALGCVLFEMLTGQKSKRYKQPGTRAGSLRAEAPSWLDDLVAKALAEDQWERWQSAGEMAAVLAAGLKTECQAGEEKEKKQREEAVRKAQEKEAARKRRVKELTDKATNAQRRGEWLNLEEYIVELHRIDATAAVPLQKALDDHRKKVEKRKRHLDELKRKTTQALQRKWWRKLEGYVAELEKFDAYAAIPFQKALDTHRRQVELAELKRKATQALQRKWWRKLEGYVAELEKLDASAATVCVK